MSKKISHKFSLIDLLMILMVVGIIFNFVVPMKQLKRNQKIIFETIKQIKFIAQKDIEFRDTVGEGDFAFDLSQLNISKNLDETYFSFAATDTTIVAFSKKETYGIEKAEFFYYLPNGPFMVAEDDISRNNIDPNWLP